MMIRALWTGATGMRAQQTNLDVISHDLANVNTVGYKKTNANFADLFYQRIRAAGTLGADGNNIPVGLQVGNGVRLTGTTKVFTQGTAQESAIATNMMVVDEGNIARNFFQVTLPNGEYAYTRDGSFTKDKDGNLVLASGEILNSGFTLPDVANDISVSTGGVVTYYDANSTQQTAGTIQLATFSNPAGLEPMGGNLFRQSESSGEAALGTPETAGFGSIKGGYTEVSNVDAISEMVGMITAQRAYEFNSRSIQTSDEMLQTINSLKQ